MKKERLIKEVKNMIQVIDDNEELFHDGIDEELSFLFIEILEYLEKEK